MRTFCTNTPKCKEKHYLEGCFLFCFLFSDGPEFKCPHTYTAVENAPHILSCNLTGYPQPDIVWRKDGKDVVLPEVLTRHDSGQYSITALSKLSNVSVTMEINVLCGYF